MNKYRDNGSDVNVAESEYYHLNINHVRHHQMKGFMPNIVFKFDESFLQQGEFYPGIDEAAYAQALEAGKVMLMKRQHLMEDEIRICRQRG